MIWKNINRRSLKSACITEISYIYWSIIMEVIWPAVRREDSKYGRQ